MLDIPVEIVQQQAFIEVYSAQHSKDASTK